MIFVIATAQQELVVRNFFTVNLTGVAIEADISDPVLAASIRAATDFDGELADIGIVILAHNIGESGAEVHRFREREIATVSARAGDDVVNLMRARCGQIQHPERGIDPLQIRDRNEREHQVLIHGDPQQTVASVFGQTRQAAKLIAREIALRHLYGSDGIAGLLLLLNVGLEPLVEFGIPFGRGVQHRKLSAQARRLRARLKTAETFRHESRSFNPAIGQDIGVFLLDLLFHPIEAALAQHELQPRHVLVLAVPVLIKNTEDRFNAIDKSLNGNEFIEQFGFARERPQTAADGHAKATPLNAIFVTDHGTQSDVIDLCAYSVYLAAGKGDFELARHAICERLM